MPLYAQPMTPAPLARLAEHVERRIRELGLDYTEVADEARFSVETLSKIRKGVSVKRSTYRKLERGLQWKAGSVAAILAGGGATPTDGDSSHPHADSRVHAVDPDDPRVQAVTTLLDSYPPEVQREVLRRYGGMIKVPPRAEPHEGLGEESDEESDQDPGTERHAG